ncbi:UPF0223 family protein [Peribacillus cavernae]|uniref:UPF0223 protein ELQ35_08135 n=1 Tax=Peribacillus cavernae TaxID=1674310 RepID=A0A3S0U3P3_9BACI|nr:UPF0223 family protein [Peribacillus cavernae]RUQ30297.1 UPF0223 family protein [Peribacillus cavernae]
MDYQYPMDMDWTTEEIVDVIHFFEAVEKAYENKIQKEELMSTYRRFKEIIPGKADEKKYTDEFQESSGYSSYLVMKKAKETESAAWISMK